MVSYASGSIRFSGLGSDTNFDEMITKLMKVESRQVNQLMRWKSDWQTRLEAFKQIRSELMNLQSTLTGLNSMNKFLAKATSSSDDKVATAVADADAMDMSYELEVKQKASYTTWTQNTGLQKKSDVICADGGSFTYTYKGKERTVTVPKETTIEGLCKIINNDAKNPGVKAQMIQSVDGIAFQLRGMDTGQSNTLVINKTVNINGLEVNPDPVNYTEEEHKVTFNSQFTDPTASINNTGSAKSFIYTVDGKRQTIDVADGDSINDLIDKINAKNPGLARLDNGYFILEKPDTTYSFSPSGDNSSFLTEILGDPDAMPPVDAKEFDADSSKILNSGDQARDIKITVDSNDGTAPNDKEYTVSIDDETTLRDLANKLQKEIGSSGTVKIVQSPNDSNKFILKIESKDATHRVTVEAGTLQEMAYVPPSDPNWDVNHAVNAKVRINGYPSGLDDYGNEKYLECASNTLKSGEVIPGVTFNLLSLGKTEIAVSTDTSKIQENVESFVQAINTFRTVLKAFTSYDEEKETLDVEYAESQFEMQKGGVLMGNYGIQTIESRLKNAVAATALGFSPRQYAADGSAISGDIYSSLSQIGIKTNAVQGDVMYGLLEINLIPNAMGSKSFADALADDPESVAKLFAMKDEGASSSDYFHYNSHIATVTKPGNYTVSYTVDAGGNISGTINGQKANYDPDTKQLTCVGDGPAKGIVVDVAERETPGSYNGTVSIKTGKVNEILGLLEGTEGILGSGGTLKNLEKNYQKIIDGIEDKIKREDTRLQKWENTMILKFSRLEKVLAQYQGIQSTLETQLAQLGTNSSK